MMNTAGSLARRWTGWARAFCVLLLLAAPIAQAQNNGAVGPVVPSPAPNRGANPVGPVVDLK